MAIKNFDKEQMKKDLNPHAEAVFAMAYFGKRYARLTCGCMGFWDTLNSSEKRFCTDVVKRIKECRSKFASRGN